MTRSTVVSLVVVCGLVVSPACSAVDVDSTAVVGVDSAVEVAVEVEAEGGRYNSPNRFLSELATASTISGKVTFRDLSLRQASCHFSNRQWLAFASSFFFCV